MNNSIKKLISLKDLSHASKVIQAFKLTFFKPLYTKWKIRTLSQKHFDDYNNKINSYVQVNQNFQLFSFSDKNALAQWTAFSDKQLGGQSEAQMYFDQSNPSQTGCRIKGLIKTTDRDKLTRIPFIGITQRSSFMFKVRCFQCVQLHLKSDGYPIHVDIIGCLMVTSRIVSKNTDWQVYQLPFINMKFQQSALEQQKSFKQFVLEQIRSPADLQIYSITLRLLDSVERERDISIKSINLAKRIGFLKFANQYHSPYFYMVKSKEHISAQENQYQNMNQIDTGDKIFIRKYKK